MPGNTVMEDAKNLVAQAAPAVLTSGLALNVVAKVVDKVWTYLNESNLSDAAKKAISEMEKTVPATLDDDFLDSLKRKDFGHTILQSVSGQKFDAAKVAGHSVKTQDDSMQVLALQGVQTNPNLKEAIVILVKFQGAIARHLNKRTDEILGDNNYTHVLLVLHQVIAKLIKKLSSGNNADELFKKIQEQLVRIKTVFSDFVNATTSDASAAERRGAILSHFKNIVDEVKNCLDRCKASKNLQMHINTLHYNLTNFTANIQRVLFGIIIEPGSDADRQLRESDKAKLSEKKLFLNMILLEDDKNQFLHQEEKQCSGYRTTLQSRAVGTLDKNPFANRTKELLDDYRKALVDKKPLTKEVFFYKILLDFFDAKIVDLKQKKKSISEFAQIYNGLKGEFTMLRRNDALPMLLKPGVDDGIFLQTLFALFQQSTEFLRFLAALNGFILVIGKIGFYNDKNLHTILKNIIENSLKVFQQNFDVLIKGVNFEVRGKWLAVIKNWFEDIQENGTAVNTALSQFSNEFNQISDQKLMEKEFSASKAEFMDAAVGMAIAFDCKADQINEFMLIMNNKQFQHFATAADVPMPSSRVLVQECYQQMGETLTDNARLDQKTRDLKSELDATADKLRQAETAITVMENSAKGLQVEVQALREKLEVLLKQETLKDDAVIDFINLLKSQLNARKIADEKAIEEARALLNSPKDLKNNNFEGFEKACRLVDILNMGKEITFQLVDLVNSFQQKYNSKKDEIKKQMEELNGIALQMKGKVEAFSETINFLKQHISDLKENIKNINAVHEKERQRLMDELKGTKEALAKAQQQQPPTTNKNSEYSAERLTQVFRQRNAERQDLFNAAKQKGYKKSCMQHPSGFLRGLFGFAYIPIAAEHALPTQEI